MTQLIQMLLPIGSPNGNKDRFDDLAKELTDRFGGVTSFVRAPAEGRWNSGTTTERDDIAVVEVMTEVVDPAYWSELKRRLQEALAQEEVIIRLQPLELL